MCVYSMYMYIDMNGLICVCRCVYYGDFLFSCVFVCSGVHLCLCVCVSACVHVLCAYGLVFFCVWVMFFVLTRSLPHCRPL